MLSDKSARDILAGLIFIGFGLAFAIASSGYEMGRAIKMGPGYLPIVMGGVLALFGVAILVQGWRRHEPLEATPIPWRGLALIVAVFVFFGIAAKGLGLAPIAFVCAAVTALASRHNSLISAAAIGLGMAILTVLVFRVGLGLSIPAFGPWLGF